MNKILFTFLVTFSSLLFAVENPLGSGDMLRISVYGNPDLNTETRVTNSGMINFPLIGEVSVADKGVPEAEKLIAKQLEDMGFLRQPQVNIVVTQFSSLQVSILGDVYKPGRIPLDKPTTLTDILAQAGGITPNGSDLISVISVVEGKSSKREFDLRDVLNNRDDDIRVSPSDIIYVHGRQVSVLGRVARPGKYSVTIGARTAIDFLALAGGITPDGSDSITVMTTNGDTPQQIQIDVDNFFQAGGEASQNIELSAGDTIYVPRAPKFYIYGEVNRSGSYRLERGMSVAQALAMGGGVSLRGTEKGLQIKRSNENGTLETIAVDTSTLILVDDVIYVKESLF